MGLELDMSAMPPGVVEEFRKGRVAREVVTLARAPRLQDLAARAHGLDGHRPVAGLGRVRMVVTADAFHYWGRRLGYECWQDEGFRREFERDNPAVRVRMGQRAGITVPGGYKPSARLAAKYPERAVVPAGKYAALVKTA